MKKKKLWSASKVNWTTKGCRSCPGCWRRGYRIEREDSWVYPVQGGSETTTTKKNTQYTLPAPSLNVQLRCRCHCYFLSPWWWWACVRTSETLSVKQQVVQQQAPTDACFDRKWKAQLEGETSVMDERSRSCDEAGHGRTTSRSRDSAGRRKRRRSRSSSSSRWVTFGIVLSISETISNEDQHVLEGKWKVEEVGEY